MKGNNSSGSMGGATILKVGLQVRGRASGKKFFTPTFGLPRGHETGL